MVFTENGEGTNVEVVVAVDQPLERVAPGLFFAECLFCECAQTTPGTTQKRSRAPLEARAPREGAPARHEKGAPHWPATPRICALAVLTTLLAAPFAAAAPHPHR